MKLALVQQHATRDRADNLRRGLEAVDRAAAAGAQVVCFAELAFEWFYPQRPADSTFRAHSETLEGPIVSALQQKAVEHGVVIVANFFERDGLDTFDTSPVIDANGVVLGMTRMVHITDYACFHEQGYYTPGDTGAPVYDTRFGKIGVAICYDRHFPEYMRALALDGADLVVVPQAGTVGEFPDGLYEAEMRVTALQNGYHIALCNRVGAEDCVTFSGESFVCGPFGDVIARAPQGQDHILHATIDPGSAYLAPARKLYLRHRRPELYADWVGRA